ncbi:unnamed protein product [Schistocephalus solidus]|uniref:Innexin n=1 Tax=Schistocephalus solidus TaxID=70667 RepID=A0A183SXB3_SCHSO|nr:unnamed protein product [Schistocephalus solidus]
MVGQEFINLFQSFNEGQRLCLEDFADRLNLFTVLLFLISCLIISTKQYVFNFISCYTPVEPSGGAFKDYVSNFCWVHGTIPFRPNEPLPSTDAEWNLYDQHRRITYYQWVPFVLGLQCILFYLPHILWKTVCTARAGGDIFTLLASARQAVSEDRQTRQGKVARVADFLEDMITEQRSDRKPSFLFQAHFLFPQPSLFPNGRNIPTVGATEITGIHRNVDNTDIPCTPSAPAILTAIATPTTTNNIPPALPDFSCPHFTSRIGLLGHLRIHRTEAGEPGPRTQAVNKMYDYCGLCVVSKRLGTCLVMSYLGIKILIVVNSALQLYLIQCFLGFSGNDVPLTDGLIQDSQSTHQNYKIKVPGQPFLCLKLSVLISIVKKYHLKIKDKTHFSLGDNHWGYAFGWTLINYIRTGREWPVTLLFPRVAYCRVPSIRVVGGDNAYTAQCALPINMLNEKLYIFLWFWICFLLTITCGSLLLWLLRIASPFHRRRFVRRYLRAHKLQLPVGALRVNALRDFVDLYLGRDGVFLVRMIAINAGQVVASEVVNTLWNNYSNRMTMQMPPIPSFEETTALATDSKEPMTDIGYV